MVQRGLTSALVLLLGLARDPGGCGDVDDPEGGSNAPCTRSKDCKHGLVCSEGVCRERDSGATAIADAGAG